MRWGFLWTRVQPGPWQHGVFALLPVGATTLLLDSVSRFAVDPSEAAHTRFLLIWCCGTLAFLAPLTSRTVLAALAPFAVALAAVGLPHVGVLRLAVCGMLLATAWWLAVRRWWQLGQEGWWAAAFAGQWLVRGELLHLAPAALMTWAELLLAPLIAAALLKALEEATGRRSATAAASGLLAFGAGPGWQFPGLLALSCGLAACRFRNPKSRILPVAFAALAWLGTDEPFWVGTAVVALATTSLAWMPRLSQLALALLAGWVSFGGSASTLPWKRPAPFEAALGVLAPPFPPSQRLLESWAATLTASIPELRLALSGRPIRTVVVESYLVASTALPCGTVVLEAHFEGTNTPAIPLLRIGENTAEWAASRPDVTPNLACPAPPWWSSWIPTTGRYLGHTFQARVPLEQPVPAAALVLRRPSGLPPELAVSIFGLRLEG